MIRPVLGRCFRPFVHDIISRSHSFCLKTNPYESGLRCPPGQASTTRPSEAFTLTLEIMPYDYEALTNRGRGLVLHREPTIGPLTTPPGPWKSTRIIPSAPINWPGCWPPVRTRATGTAKRAVALGRKSGAAVSRGQFHGYAGRGLRRSRQHGSGRAESSRWPSSDLKK